MGTPHTLMGTMPTGDTALDVAMEDKELGSNPFTVLQFQQTCIIMNADLKIKDSEKKKEKHS